MRLASSSCSPVNFQRSFTNNTFQSLSTQYFLKTHTIHNVSKTCSWKQFLKERRRVLKHTFKFLVINLTFSSLFKSPADSELQQLLAIFTLFGLNKAIARKEINVREIIRLLKRRIMTIKKEFPFNKNF